MGRNLLISFDKGMDCRLSTLTLLRDHNFNERDIQGMSMIAIVSKFSTEFKDILGGGSNFSK